MPISQSDALFSLIKSLTKSEKRNFKLYVKKTQREDQETKFLQLFIALDQMDSYKEAKVLNNLTSISKTQLPNLRRHLYQHLCTSLRLINIKKKIDTQVRELIDYAGILYDKGLYLQALKLLNKAKGIAIRHHLDIMHLEILEFEKRVEFRHITRSLRGNTGTLTEEADIRASIIQKNIHLSNLALELQGYYIKNGQAYTSKEASIIQQQLGPKLPAIGNTAIQRTFFEKIYLFQAYYWFFFIQNNFSECQYYTNRALRLFGKFPAMKQEDVEMYMRLLHQDISVSFQKGDSQRLIYRLQELESCFEGQQQVLNHNPRLMGELYLQLARLNRYLIDKDFSGAQLILPQTLEFIEIHQAIIDPHRIMVFYYKIAAIYMGNNQTQEAIYYLSKIINDNGMHLREDIQIYSRVLFLMAHYDLGNYDVMEFLCPQYERFFKKLNGLDPLQKACFSFLKLIFKLPPDQKPNKFQGFHEQLLILSEDVFLQRAFAYLDIISWIDKYNTR